MLGCFHIEAPETNCLHSPLQVVLKTINTASSMSRSSAAKETCFSRAQVQLQPRASAPRISQVHKDGGDALAAVLGPRIELIVEEVVVRVVLLTHLRRNYELRTESSAKFCGFA